MSESRPEGNDHEVEQDMPKNDNGWKIALFLAGVVLGLSTQWIAFIKDAASEEFVRTEIREVRAVADAELRRIEYQAREDRAEIKAALLRIEDRLNGGR